MTASRRTVIKSAAAAMLAARMRPLAAAGPPDPDAALRPVGYGDVTWLEGPVRDQFMATHQTLLALDEDALLQPFRAAVGQAAPGPSFGGWYNASPRFAPPADLTGYIPGHCFGQLVSAMARAYAVTGDAATLAKVRRLLAGLAPTLSPRFYQDYPLPAYTFDKTVIGLIDAHRYGAAEGALALLDRATDAALPFLPDHALTRPEMAARPHPNVSYTWDESYTLPENLYLAAELGAGARYHALARRYLMDGAYFDPLAAGDNVLPGKHAYSHVNALSSAMQAYISDGSAKHLQAARQGFDFVLEQSYATGGWGPGERFITPGSGALGDSLEHNHDSFETPCGAYGHFKIARHLLCASGDSRYGDSLERVLYNTVLGALPARPDGTSFYYADYNLQGAKVYYDYACPCCFGTLGQVTADYAISAYQQDRRSVFVTLYIPSRLRWRQGDAEISLTQTTRYPLDDAVSLEISCRGARAFRLCLRIPAWAGPATTVSVNGQTVASAPPPGRFLPLERPWRNGDRVLLQLDRTLRLEAVDAQHPDHLAVMHGPLALFATGDRFLPLHRDDLRAVRQRGAGSADYSVTVDGAPQLFRPYYAVGGEATRLYQPVTG